MEIVGHEAKGILNLPVTSVDLSVKDDTDAFWNVPNKRSRSLQVIVTPYRPGSHVATKPKSFVPIIRQLEKLHAKGFVHGDIRAFNTVFGEDTDEGFLIDFDMGGKAGKRKFPEGYCEDIPDGKRCIGEDNHKNFIQKWHDWFALGRLIFVVHEFVIVPPGTPDAEKGQLANLNDEWKALDKDPTPKMIRKLEDCLNEAQNKGWTMKPERSFQTELKRICYPKMCRKGATNPRATGSPLEKKR